MSKGKASLTNKKNFSAHQKGRVTSPSAPLQICNDLCTFWVCRVCSGPPCEVQKWNYEPIKLRIRVVSLAQRARMHDKTLISKMQNSIIVTFIAHVIPPLLPFTFYLSTCYVPLRFVNTILYKYMIYYMLLQFCLSLYRETELFYSI